MQLDERIYGQPDTLDDYVDLAYTCIILTTFHPVCHVEL